MMTPSLITTKLYTPHLRPDLVLRSPLIERLKAGLHCPLTLISAPAGYGKTTLLAELANNIDLPAARAGDAIEVRQSRFVLGIPR